MGVSGACIAKQIFLGENVAHASVLSTGEDQRGSKGQTPSQRSKKGKTVLTQKGPVLIHFLQL